MAGTPETLLARSTLSRYLGVVEGEPVTIEAWSHALGWARPFVAEARLLGARPLLALEDEEEFFRALSNGRSVPTAPAALRRLARARRLTVSHPNGTRLELEVRAGRWVEETGRSPRPEHRGDRTWTNVPTGRLTLPVVPGSATGAWEANRPSFDRFGETAVGVGARFGFRDGSLTDFAFDRGGEGFSSSVPGPRRAPEVVRAVSFGLNPRVARAPEIGDLALGALGLRLSGPRRAGSRPSLGSVYVSLLHGAMVELDGRPWLVEGRAFASGPSSGGSPRPGRRKVASLRAGGPAGAGASRTDSIADTRRSA
jgi:hypothetical protein